LYAFFFFFSETTYQYHKSGELTGWEKIHGNQGM